MSVNCAFHPILLLLMNDYSTIYWRFRRLEFFDVLYLLDLKK